MTGPEDGDEYVDHGDDFWDGVDSAEEKLNEDHPTEDQG